MSTVEGDFSSIEFKLATLPKHPVICVSEDSRNAVFKDDFSSFVGYTLLTTFLLFSPKFQQQRLEGLKHEALSLVQGFKHKFNSFHITVMKKEVLFPQFPLKELKDSRKIFPTENTIAVLHY